MYRCSNGQISLSDFKQPVGMNLKESNRIFTTKWYIFRLKKMQKIEFYSSNPASRLKILLTFVV